ncbi:MAG: GTPase Era [Bacteroidetes bacterium]|nr:GTPase Era [Bacteroidota bacterium]
MSFRAGFVSIIGMPNAGKSTLHNALMGDKLAIVNPKAQTTRHRILGIKTGENAQVIYSDTPGILRKASYKMHEKMMAAVHESIDDSDVLILLLDVRATDIPEELLRRFEKSSAKKIVAINKIDTVKQDQLEAVMLKVAGVFKADAFMLLSALNNFQLDKLETEVISYLPEHPAYFPEDQITDRSERFFVNEIIRNHALKLYEDEVPYSLEVTTLFFKEEKKIIRLSCELVVERDSQKRIIIGNKGEAIKRLGTNARKDLEAFFGKHIFVELFVKVREDWRNSKNMLKQFGYDLD